MKSLKLLPLLLVCATCNAQINSLLMNKTDLQMMNLKGPVSCVKTYKHEKVEYYSLEELGVYKRKGVEPPGYVDKWKHTEYFNVYGNIVSSRSCYAYYGDNYDKKYNSDNKILSITNYKGDSTIYDVYSFQYDNRGYLFYASKVKNGNITLEENYTCDANGKIVSIYSKRQSSPAENISVEYSNGKLSKMTIKDREKPSMVVVLDIDRGEPKEMFSWKNGELTYKLFEYNTDYTQATIKSGNSTTDLYLNQINNYDSNGNIIKSVVYNKDGEITQTDTYTYEYDKYGNWILCTRNSSVSYYNTIEFREITYRK